MRNRSTNGFTLIELLIVIAIIGILAAVLIPNLLAARTRANDAVTKAFLNEGATQQEIYQIDNNTYASAFTDFDSNIATASRFSSITNEGFGTVTASTYCMEAEHSGGTGYFYVTNEGGIQEGQCP